ncbi:hypothetical protein N474_04740 [Pseudoalteromonas luteoviolacea CPMOR-2]|uniref:hypothetical protein n=1 Tax=Pseudoalteromonas luteoviolacea TaxID=43657 RepID=UPI0007B08CCB|nr:hypothetical protein [Pseudoalteromonas luteoviolacea]KZN49568.1 hypothetical protein N474_04740 [Pseudoalteromonas luteoviolacea CPMOR-2]
MPTTAWSKTWFLLFCLSGLSGCVNSELSLEEKIAQQEAIHAHKNMIASYDKNKASIERLAQMEGDLSQLLALLSEEAQVTDIQTHLNPEKETIKHAAMHSEVQPTQLASERNDAETEILIPDLVLGIHMKRDMALRQVDTIEDRLAKVRQHYHLVFNSVRTQLVEPNEQQHLYYVTANGFTSLQEASVFCKAMVNIAKRCRHL